MEIYAEITEFLNEGQLYCCTTQTLRFSQRVYDKNNISSTAFIKKIRNIKPKLTYFLKELINKQLEKPKRSQKKEFTEIEAEINKLKM